MTEPLIQQRDRTIYSATWPNQLFCKLIAPFNQEYFFHLSHVIHEHDVATSVLYRIKYVTQFFTHTHTHTHTNNRDFFFPQTRKIILLSVFLYFSPYFLPLRFTSFFNFFPHFSPRFFYYPFHPLYISCPTFLSHYRSFFVNSFSLI